jgi:hypothetical protein
MKTDSGFGLDAVVKPKGSAHITVLPTIEVQKNPELAYELLILFNTALTNMDEDEVKVKYGPIQHTFDERYPPYLSVVSVDAHCKVVNQFRRIFWRGTQRDPRTMDEHSHMTFAVRLRK